MPCPFCFPDPDRIVAETPLALALLDGFPVTPGHTLVVPRAHSASLYDLPAEQQQAVWDLVARVRADLLTRDDVDAVNIGLNDGMAAGQTVMHAHVHVIPRRSGDMTDPRGGVRHVIPGKGNYLAGPTQASQPLLRARPLVTGGASDRFIAHIRPLLHTATDVAIVAAFVQRSGIDSLAHLVEEALDRQARFRVITGDYLHITQAHALHRLLDWSGQANDFSVRIVKHEVVRRAFHPKAWLFTTPSGKVAYVGSSNWSHSALETGMEWNLCVEDRLDPDAHRLVVQAFDRLWDSASPLTQGWLDDYTDRAPSSSTSDLLGEAEELQSSETFEPRPPQDAALRTLANSRAQGRERALAVLATGLGKTFLAAFDVRAFAAERGRMPRVLFVAHQRQLLTQAGQTFRKVFPRGSIGHFFGDNNRLDAQITLASIQKLHADGQRDLSGFDYVVLDEVHHAAASTYRALLARLQPGFLLGLTATPERTDQADVAGIFDDHVPVRVDLAEGIDRQLLAPFHYLGVADTIQFEPIPWRSYTTDRLAELASTQERMETLWKAWREQPGSRTLVFCVSIAHADFVRDWLIAKGVRALACHTGPGAAERDNALDALARGELDAICAVDLFNEGIDVPNIDRVVMLRPTASPVVFLQQLGRGLRKAPGKAFLQVIDLIGNHRAFLQRVRSLLSLARTPVSLPGFVKLQKALDLPSGCHVELELEVLDILGRLLPKGSTNETIRVYRELRDLRAADEPGWRPPPGELVRRGLNPGSLRSRAEYSCWFDFVRVEGDLGEGELAAFGVAQEWLRSLETTPMSKSFKMVTLQVLLDADALFDGMDVATLAERCHGLLCRNPELFSDLEDVRALPEPRTPGKDTWLSYWRTNPIAAWCRSRWFKVEDDVLLFRLAAPEEVRADVQELTRQMVDWRIAQYRRRVPAADGRASSFVCNVSHNNNNPILFLPTADRDTLPMGPTDVRLLDGSVWQFRFVKVAINVAGPIGESGNRLPDLLRSWFGPGAGRSGTQHRVRFRRSPEGWWVEPLGQVVELPALGHVVSYPSLQAAAGVRGAGAKGPNDPHPDQVKLPFSASHEHFAVRVSGHSMDGGPKPMRDGDWAVLKWARGLGWAAIQNRVVLVGPTDPSAPGPFFLKRAVRTDEGWELRPDNPGVPLLAADSDTEVYAVVVDNIPPEQLGPVVGTCIRDGEVGQAFGLDSEPQPAWSRVEGHLFVFVQDKGQLTVPDAVADPVGELGPGETAFVLLKAAGGWRYLGVGRQADDGWRITEVDHATWREWGKGRSSSRRLAERWRQAAEAVVADLAPGWVEARGRRCRVVGPSAQGGVRLNGGPGGFAERTVSVTDLGWVLCAREHARVHGGAVDQAMVNRLRYLDGTPKESTRWIDTGWALVLTEGQQEA